MKTLVSFLAAAWSGLVFAASPADPGTMPEGLKPSEWSDIRAAHDAARHVPQRQKNGHFVARNPGQQWSAEFDGKGFTVTPDHGAWTWGLTLTRYGNRTLPSFPSQLHHESGRITCQRDENLTEWFINDSRGLEQGWDLQQRPERADPAEPLQLHLSTRGNIRPQVSAGGNSVSFHPKDGGKALNYGGLKAWDADGKELVARFEQASGNGIRIAVDDQNARYPITIDPIAQQAYLKASTIGEADLFGSAVAISGDTVVIGAPEEDSAATGVDGDQASNAASNSGAVYVFLRTGTTWTQQAYLKASNSGADDGFGTSVAISGDTLVVGAIREDSAATGVNGDQASSGAPDSGAAYVFTRSGTVWTQQAYLKASNPGGDDGISNNITGDSFGQSVAISGDSVIVGSPGEASSATGVNGNQADNSAINAGAAYVFTRNGTTWTQQAYLKASNSGASDVFGYSVAISADTAVVGALNEGSSATGVNGDGTNNSSVAAGAAYVFIRTGTTWTQEAYLKASNTGESDEFGRAVAISGDTVVVGASREDSSATGVDGDQLNNGASSSGAAYVFARSGTVWTQQAYLKASHSAALNFFGWSVAISGDKVAVGARLYKSGSGASETGATCVFSRSGTTWTHMALLKASNPGSSDAFGTSVGISGDTVISGAPREDSGSNSIQIDNSASESGAAYITHLNLATLPQDIFVRMSAVPIDHGGTKAYGPAATGSTMEFTFEVGNNGEDALILTGSPAVTVAGSSDFTVSSQPEPGPISGPGGSTTFKVVFAPTGQGSKSATLSIPNNDASKSPFIIHLTGTALSFTSDTDSDGLSDGSEFNMAALGFNWQVKQTALVSNYFSNAHRAGLYTPTQVHALRAVTPLIERDPASSRFKLTMDWKRATNLADFSDFPAPAGSAVSITPAGDIEFEFPAPDNAAFFKIEHD